MFCTTSMLEKVSQERKFCTTSKTDHHLSRQKIRQRISVMKTNTLYSSRFSRELAFSFTFCLEVNKNTKITENLWRNFWRDKWRSVFDVVQNFRYNGTYLSFVFQLSEYKLSHKPAPNVINIFLSLHLSLGNLATEVEKWCYIFICRIF